MELMNILSSRYKPGEPIFASDIRIDGMSEVYLRQCFMILSKKNILMRFENGVYYFPKNSVLKNSSFNGLSSNTVAYSKYISRNNKVDGYYSGYTFANQLGISVQVPAHKEITTNNIAAKKRDIKLGNSIYIVRHSKVPVTKQNQKVLQLLELLSHFDEYSDENYDAAKEKISIFIKQSQIKRADIDSYIDFFPALAYKNIRKLGLDNVFA